MSELRQFGRLMAYVKEDAKSAKEKMVALKALDVEGLEGARGEAIAYWRGYKHAMEDVSSEIEWLAPEEDFE